MKSPRPAVQMVYGLVTLAVLALSFAGVAAANTDSGEVIPRIMYVHLPAAAVTLLACGLVFICSIGHLMQPRRRWDDMAQAAGLVAVVACTTLLVTGMFWGKLAWGDWWTWSPGLTFSLVLWALYAGYLVHRPLVAAHRRATVSSCYGVVAFLDVPLVYMSVKMLPDVHPSSIAMNPSMKRTLLACTIAAGMIAWGYIVRRVALHSPAAAEHPVVSATLERPPTVPPTMAH